MLAGSVTPLLTRAQAVAMLRAVTVRAQQPVDPYGDSTISTTARGAFVEMISERSDLGDVVAELVIAEQVTTADMPTSAELAASAARRDPREGWRSVGTLIEAWKPSADVRQRFLRACDRLITQMPQHPAQRDRFRRGRQSTKRLISLPLAVLSGPILAAVVGGVAYRQEWTAPKVTVGLAEALAALAVVATVNVFTVQLSATRLPGPVARVASQSISLRVAYSTALIVVLASVVSLNSKRWSSAVQWGGVLSAATFSVALIVGLLTFARRTDPGEAAEAYRRASTLMFRRSGKKLGKLQAEAKEIRDTAADLNGVTLTPERVSVGERVPVLSIKRGVFMPNMKRLGRIASMPEFESGMVSLQISGRIGTVIEEGESLATLVPNRSGIVSPRLQHRAGRALAVRRIRDLDETTTSAVGLVALAGELADRRDFGTARVVAQVAALLVAEHVKSAGTSRRKRLARDARRARRADENSGSVVRPGVATAAAEERARDRSLSPVVPALRSTALAAASLRLRADGDPGDVPDLVLVTLLEVSERSDATAAMLLSAIPRTAPEAKPSPYGVGELFLMIYLRAMETSDTQTVLSVRKRLSPLLQDSHLFVELSEVASIMGCLTCWTMPNVARECLDWYATLETAGPDGSSVHRRQIGLSRIGAAAVLTGLPSIASSAADHLEESGALDEWQKFMLTDEVRLREEAISMIRGGYLGPSPSDALNNFFSFAKQVRA